jgi:hypothetical protein
MNSPDPAAALQAAIARLLRVRVVGRRCDRRHGTGRLSVGVPASAAIQVWAIRKLDGKSTVKAFVDRRIGGVSLKGKIVQQPEQHAWLVPGASS